MIVFKSLFYSFLFLPIKEDSSHASSSKGPWAVIAKLVVQGGLVLEHSLLIEHGLLIEEVQYNFPITDKG